MFLKMCFKNQFCIESNFQSSDYFLIEAHFMIFNSNVSFLNQLFSFIFLLLNEEHCFCFDCVKLCNMSLISFFNCFCYFRKSITDLLYWVSADHNFNIIYKKNAWILRTFFLCFWRFHLCKLQKVWKRLKNFVIIYYLFVAMSRENHSALVL